MKAKVIETGEIVNVTPYPTWYKENGQGPDRREWDEDELEFIYSNDNVEPKFHEGDWAVSNLDGKARQVSEVHFDEYNSYYVVDGKSVNLEEYDRLHYLWTIADAKDGDVLAIDPWSDYPSSFVAIYKKQNEEDFDSYCFVGFDGKFYKGENGHSTEDIHPATKEQRDIFFQKMKEAGYEWDAEKKELKKIEENSFESDRVEKALRKAGYEWSEETHQLKKIEQKSVWCPSKKQMESLKDMLKYNIGVFDYQKFMEVNSLYDDLKKIIKTQK